jgi:hypothetical protein
MNNIRSSEIEIDKLHQSPPVYDMVADSYSEVTWRITNNKRLKFSKYSCPDKRVFGKYPCDKHTQNIPLITDLMFSVATQTS